MRRSEPAVLSAGWTMLPVRNGACASGGVALRLSENTRRKPLFGEVRRISNWATPGASSQCVRSPGSVIRENVRPPTLCAHPRRDLRGALIQPTLRVDPFPTDFICGVPGSEASCVFAQRTAVSTGPCCGIVTAISRPLSRSSLQSSAKKRRPMQART
jgi:hypothetical protein